MSIRETYFSIKNHYRLYLLILILCAIIARMFHQNYIIVSPVMSKHQASYNDLLGSLAGCESAANIAANDAAILANNPDLK